MTRARRNPTLQVVADDTAATSRAGTALLLTLADRLGLTGGLSRAMAPTRERRSPHDPGGVLRDLAVMLADGGDCLHDLGAIRDQVDLFGRVASDATAWRVIDAIDQGRLQAIRAARARARERAWAAGARPAEVVLDIDATLVQAHSDKEGAAPTYKRGYGFHPMLCYLDASGEALAGTLRPGNAGANTARDHIAVLLDALDQLPAAVREGAWVAELDGVSLTGWPAGSRLVCRRERPHPGAQFSFTDQDGHRFQVILTNQPGDAVALEARHRARARVEDAIRAAKDTGLQNLPFREFAPNAVWLELVLVAQDLIAWGQRLLLGGELARCEPKRLRYRLLHVAARITRSGRRLRLHLPAHWPWAGALVAAFRRLRGLPAPAGSPRRTPTRSSAGPQPLAAGPPPANRRPSPQPPESLVPPIALVAARVVS